MTGAGERGGPVGAKHLNLFERYLSLWVALCIAAGVGLGMGVPGVVGALARLEVHHVNLPVAVLIWLWPPLPARRWSSSGVTSPTAYPQLGPQPDGRGVPEDKVFIRQLEEKLAGDQALTASICSNTPENARLTFNHVVTDRLQDMVDTNFKFYKRVTDDRAFAKYFLDWFFERFRTSVIQP